MFLLLWAWCVQITCRRSARDAATLFTNLCQWAPLASIILVAFACSYPFTRPADWLIWLPTFAAAWLLPRKFNQLHLNDHNPNPRSPLATISKSSDRVLQKITRSRLADGRQAAHATLTCEFAPGQRTATTFVAFCPPFNRLPEADVDFDDANIATVKLTQVLHHGAQLDVSLACPAMQDSTASVRLFAVEPEQG
jgi:hypothetical protein